jgi:hypothetical protein
MIKVLSVFKEIAALPATLLADSIYVVRRGLGFDLYVTDSTGLLAFKVNSESDLKSPQFTYNTANQVSRIDYANGIFKLFTYSTTGLLQTMTLNLGNSTMLTKTFSYNASNLLTGVVET